VNDRWKGLALCLLILGACSAEEGGAPPDQQIPVDGGLPSPDAAGLADVPAAPDLGPDQLQPWGPPYPIVLAHGFFGFKELGPLDYFHEVKPALEADGHVVVVTAVDPFNSTYVRGGQLLQQVLGVLAQSGAAKVNIIGHSQGGFDARYVARIIPEQIGAVVTIGTPHQGAHIADVMAQAAPGFSVELAQAFVAAVSGSIWGSVADDPDLQACLDFLTSQSIAEFNSYFPDEAAVAYYSIAGRSNSDLATTACSGPDVPPFITKYADAKDPIDPLLSLVAPVVGGSTSDPEPNDGLVRVSEAKRGIWLGCIPADHWDEVGQLLGDSPGSGNPFDHVAFYRDLASFLVDQGF
jgi:triacylglycerol lipase